MFLESTRYVMEPDERPARADGTCFYCRVPLGGEHNDDCVVRSRSVVIEAKVRLIVEVPADWDEGMIEFKYNESSSCADNVIREIEETADRVDGAGSCMCPHCEVQFIKEANENDHDDFHYRYMRR